MIDLSDTASRLGAATLVGAIIGLNRNIHHKPTGVRTMSIVALGSALAVLSASEAGTGANAASPVIQGIVTGIGFLGAGVIVHSMGDKTVRGLTTAATIWLTAALGCAFGLGQWGIALTASSLVALVLIAGGRIEKAVHHKIEGDDEEGVGSPTIGGPGN